MTHITAKRKHSKQNGTHETQMKYTYITTTLQCGLCHAGWQTVIGIAFELLNYCIHDHMYKLLSCITNTKTVQTHSQILR